MFVSSLSVKVGGDSTVIERRTDVQEGYRCKRIIGCKLNSRVNAIEISSEGLEVVKRVCPYHEDVVYKMPPYVWLEWST